MKKVISLLLASLLAAGMMVSCGNGSESSVTNSEPSSQTSQESSEESSEEESSEEVFEYTKLDTEMNIAVLKGPTGLGALKLMQDNEDGTALLNYNFSIHGSPEEIVSKIATGELDVAAVASNLASTLYTKTEKNVEILAVNTLGILYVMQKGDENITSLSDLKGKTIISSGQGTTAQYVVEYLLAKNGIDPAADVTIEYKSEHSEVVATLATMDSAVAILPQPFVTTAQMQDENLSIALDLNQEWEAVTGEKLPMGCIIARKDYIAENPEAIETFLYEYALSTQYANENPEETGAISESFDMIKAAVASKAIPYCSITYLDGEEMKASIGAFLQILYDFNPASIGGNIPDDEFYYAK